MKKRKFLSVFLCLAMGISEICQFPVSELSAADTDAAVNYGDANEDEIINIVDLIKTKSYLIEKNENDFNKTNMDVDMNGEVNTTDFVQLKWYLQGLIPCFYGDMGDDTDKDGLPDVLEKETYFTDYKKADTDGDGIDDYAEVILLHTDPLSKLTGSNKTSDDELDYDNDGLSNKEELEFGSSMILADTDADGLSDLEEKNLKTDPNMPDTDGDGLSDKAEVILGTSPVDEKTDGSISDSQIFIQQSYDENAEVFSWVNSIAGSYRLSADIEAKGYGEENLKISQSIYSDYLDSNLVYGPIIDISYSGELKNMTLKFSGKDMNKYCIFEYSEEEGILYPCDNDVTETSLTLENAEEGTYCLIEMKKYDSSGNAVVVSDQQDNTDPNISKGKDIYILEYFPFSYDVGRGSESCINNPGALLADTIKKLVKNNEDIHIYCMHVNGLVISSTKEKNRYIDSETSDKEIERESGYYSKAHSFDDISGKYIRNSWTLAGSLWGESFPIESEYTKKENYTYFKGYDVMSSYTDREKYCIVIDNGIVPACDNAEDVIDSLKKSKVNFSFFYGSGNPNASRYRELATNSSAKLLNEYTFYSDICNIINSGSGSSENIYNSVFGNIYMEKPVDFNSFTDLISGDYTTDELWEKYDLADTDGDKDPDIAEIDPNSIDVSSGKFMAFTYKKQLERLIEEKRIRNIKQKYYGDADYSNSIFEQRYIRYKTSPNKKDTDGDGVPDNYDANPEKGLDKEFTSRDKYNYDPKDLVTNPMIKNFLECSELHDTMAPDMYSIYDPEVSAAGIVLILGELSKLQLINTGYCVSNYVNIQPKDYYKVFKLPIEMYEVIAKNYYQRKSYYEDMNHLMKNVEDNLLPGGSMNVSGNTNGIGSVMFSALPAKYLATDYLSYIFYYDMMGSIHSGSNTLVSKIKCTEEENGIKYTADVKYYVFDSYDWNENEYCFQDFSFVDSLNPIVFVMKLNPFGLAHPFMTYSCIETSVSWYKGQRYPDTTPDERSGDSDARTVYNNIKESGIEDTRLTSYLKKRLSIAS